MSAPFEAGERALLMDKRGRRYLITLRAGDQFHFHHGYVQHDALIGSHEGVRVYASTGTPLIAFRPSLAEFVLKMPRGAQVIYPKDIALILVYADIYPGATVLEAGTGSGALTLGLSRAVGEHGRVISYEMREDFAERARANIESFLGKVPDHIELRSGDVLDPEPEDAFDRIVLDLPEPWHAMPMARRRLRAGGIFCSYVPTVLQVQQTAEALRSEGFTDVETFEALVRHWHVEGKSVRPDHRMVAHTGFITTARLLDV
jgi:tRNA (adenine57-N1/adenine58-N1)-methyltransferase catalytic subunit